MTPPIRPNVNPTGVPGFENCLNLIDENSIVHEAKFKDESLFTYYKKSSSSNTDKSMVLQVKESNNGSVEYLYYDNGKPVRAYDRDGDGNIDDYKLVGEQRYVDITDSGKGLYMKKAWYNPLTWF